MTNQKLLTICIVGKPNAGKSTLLNRLIGQKISIVTPKVQTTRSIITGIVTLNDTQLILFDTPGIFEPKKRLEKAMVRCAWSSLNGADMVVLILDSSKKINELSDKIIDRLNEQRLNLVVLLNKSDLKSKLTKENEEFIHTKCPGRKVFHISALTGQGVEDFSSYLINSAKISNWHYEEDDLTNLPMRFIASEITREQLFLNLQEELPYNLTVESESWQQQKDGSVKINQVIIVSRETYKTIILGKNGSMIKLIGSNARKNIEEFLGQKVHLFLFVKVRSNWDSNPASYDYLGLKLEK